MRKDVKAGLVLALGVVIVAGWYYSGKKGTEPAVPLAERGAKTGSTKTASKQKARSSKSAAADRKGRHASKRSTNQKSTKKPTASSQDRLASSKQAKDSSKRKSKPLDTSIASKDGKKKDSAAKGLNDVGSTLTGLNKPKAQAAPPVDKKRGDSTPGKSAVGTKGGLGADDKSSVTNRDAKKAKSKETDRSTKTSAKDPHKKSDPKLPNMDGSDRYVVQPGDSFMLLAEVYYGSQSHAGFLMRANPHVSDPKRLRVGTEIRIPKLPKKTAKRSQARGGLLNAGKSSGKTYTVESGDSLTSIAEQELGATARWKELYELNKDIIRNPDILRAGVVLILPD